MAICAEQLYLSVQRGDYVVLLVARKALDCYCSLLTATCLLPACRLPRATAIYLLAAVGCCYCLLLPRPAATCLEVPAC